MSSTTLSALVLSELLLQRLDPDATTPANRQIYQIVRHAILSGELPAGAKLPATRLLAREIDRSRNTVLHAYDQLLAEGYIHARTGSGTFVSDTHPDQLALASSSPTSSDGATSVQGQSPPRPSLSRRGRQLLARAGVSDQQWGAFVPGVPDVTMFPHATWSRLTHKHWRRPPPALLTYAQHGGYMPLRRALAEYLRLARSVNCEPEQVLLTAGIHQSLDIITRLLGDVGDRAWMENPGYWGARNILVSNGIEPQPIELDAEGMQPGDALLQTPPRFIFVTPSHQYPLGTVMSLARRRMLLEYARQHGSWIIEDDYDSEFRFEGRPLASVQGLDRHDRVIYLGTFSKTLFPGLRIGFMVLPRPLVAHFSSGLAELYREGQLMQQAVLADFIGEGHYAAHIRRMRHCYAERQSVLRQAIANRFGNDWPTSPNEAGLHLVLHLPDGTDDLDIAHQARRAGLVARPLSRYYAVPAQSRPGVLLGYACVPTEQIAPAFGRLAQIVQPAIERGARAAGVPRARSGNLNPDAWSGA